jgi:hypothetical protein
METLPPSAISLKEIPFMRQTERSVANGVATIRWSGGQAGGQLVDLSERGAQVLCHLSAAVGESVEVSLQPEGFPETITTRGQVKRVLPDRVGIEIELAESWAKSWQRICEYYEPETRLVERFPAQGEAAFLTSAGWVNGRLENVSKGGLQIQLSVGSAVGEHVEVRFFPPGQVTPVTVQGRVARNQGGRVGIDFAQASMWDASWRKMVAFQTVKQDKMVALLTPEELMERIAATRREAEGESGVAAKTKALWKMESLGVTIGRVAGSGDSLSNAKLPEQACPISHVGMGGAAVEVSNFDAAKITRMIDSLARPEYRLFSYEQIGAMLGVYEKSVPRLMLGLKALNRPEDAPFIASFPMEVQRLISHGFGRLLYFNSKNLDEALRNIKARTFLDTAAAVQGMAFGYTMVNHEDLSTVLATGGSLMDGKLIAAFQAGLIYALMFWEWCWPGFLNTLTPPHAQAGKLIAAAQREIADAKQVGALPPFKVTAGVLS